jgi:class 3 adenylate cyclase
VYCSAQPVRRAHIRLSQEIAPGESRPIDTALTPGRYRARRRGEQSVAPLVVLEGAESGQVVHWGAEGMPDRIDVGPAPQFELVGGEGAATTFIIEEVEWDATSLQPAHLFNLQEFRDLFNEQYLAAGVQLHIGEQTVLFTDIVGSTKFYADVGDPTAFVEVKKHFAEVYAAVAAQSGAVVKTIGDAVMAAFSDPLAAVRAAYDIHRKFSGADDPGLRLRASVNTGPCIAVNLNSGIDYFGGTVNTAAKLQRCAEAGEVALSSNVMSAPGIRDALNRLGGPVRQTQLAHDALGLLDVAVWRPPTAP